MLHRRFKREPMADPNALDFLRIPSDVLVALDWRPYHFALQPYHYLVRAGHVVSMAAFFGGIAALDLRLMGWGATLPLRPVADHVLPWLYVTFTVAIVSGVALFFYDPVHVGSHAYFSLKLLLIALGLVNAALFRRSGYLAAAEAPASVLPVAHARLVAGVSLALWIGVVICACLNVEAAPKVLLR
jgi:hypothetical protein